MKKIIRLRPAGVFAIGLTVLGLTVAAAAATMAGMADPATRFQAPPTTVSGQSTTDEAAIRSARSRSNAAITRHDVAAIVALWMPDFHIVTSTSAQSTGREANGQRMSEQFKRRPDTIYVRTPATVDVNAPWAVASERGEWTGRWTEPDGVVEIGGAYLAQWRKIDGAWLIQAELFVPTHCRGSAYCAKRP